MADYVPINCDFYDHFELHALKKTWLEIKGIETDQPTYRVTKIKTLITRDGSEYAIFLDDSELRLDRVTEMIPIIDTTSGLGYLLDLLEYNKWANDRILKCISGQEVSRSVISTMSHIINADDIWYNRVNNSPINFSIWEDHSISNMPDLMSDLFIKIVALFEKHKLNDTITYQNLSGNKFESTFSEIIVHLVNHSTYHRGQIIQLLQQSNLKTVSSDYIVYSRKTLL